MKKLSFLLCVLLILSTSATSASESYDPTNPYNDHYDSSYGQGGHYDSDYGFSGWSTQVSRILISKRRRALREYQLGRVSNALNIFKQGIRRAHQASSSPYNSSMSYKWINRTVLMLREIETSLPTNRKTTRLLSLFLDKSFEFLISHSLKFDQQYYTYDYGYRIPSVEGIERRYIEDIFSHLSKMANSFVTEDYNGNIYPFGSLGLTKKVFELISLYGNLDLYDSFLSEYYNCHRRRLWDIGHTLKSLPNGQLNVYMMTDIYNDINQIIQYRRCY